VTEDRSTEGQQRKFEVGVEGMAGDYEHVLVRADSPEEAFEKGEDNYTRDLKEPVNAYQAFDVDKGVTHRNE
jgi:hypothetical protein